MTQEDLGPRYRSGVTLPDACWDWLAKTAAHDGSSRDDLVEGLVLLAMDREETAAAAAKLHAKAEAIRARRATGQAPVR